MRRSVIPQLQKPLKDSEYRQTFGAFGLSNAGPFGGARNTLQNSNTDTFRLALRARHPLQPSKAQRTHFRLGFAPAKPAGVALYAASLTLHMLSHLVPSGAQEALSLVPKNRPA